MAPPLDGDGNPIDSSIANGGIAPIMDADGNPIEGGLPPVEEVEMAPPLDGDGNPIDVGAGVGVPLGNDPFAEGAPGGDMGGMTPMDDGMAAMDDAMCDAMAGDTDGTVTPDCPMGPDVQNDGVADMPNADSGSDAV